MKKKIIGLVLCLFIAMTMLSMVVMADVITIIDGTITVYEDKIISGHDIFYDTQIIINSDKTLDVSGCFTITSGSNGVVNNGGTLILPLTADPNSLNIIGGTVMVGSKQLINEDGIWMMPDVSSTGLDISDCPTVKTIYKAGVGTITFTPAAGTTTPATLTLNNASTQGSITVPAAMVVEEGKTATVNSLSDDPVILTATAGFTNQGTLIINSTLVEIATTTGGFTNEGTVNIVNGEMLDLSGCNTITSTGSIVNNGNLGLPTGFPVADLDQLHITGNGVVTIGGVTYSKLNGQWMQDISSKGLDFSTTAPTVETTYKAGTGTVTFTPATTEPAAPARLVFDGATIAVSKTATFTDVTTVNLPDEAVDVTFRGTNSISASTTKAGKAFSATKAVTFTLEEGSTTTLTAVGNTSQVISSTGDVTIDGSGALNLKPMVNGGELSSGYAIYTTGNVSINGGTVCEQRVASDITTNIPSGTDGIEATGVTLGTFTIPAGGTLDLHNATVDGNIPATVTNKGTLILPTGKTEANVPVTIGGIIIVGDDMSSTSYKSVDGAWALDVTTTGLDISGLTQRTVFTAGEGTITFTPATTDPVAPATLTLNNATIAPTTYESSMRGVALLLGDSDINLVLEGSSSLKGFRNMAMCGDGADNACGAVTISGTGSLVLNGSSSYGSFYADSLNLTDTATVTSSGGTVTGDVTVNPGANLNAILTVGASQKVYGKHTIAENESKSYPDSVLEWDDDASMEVNGLLKLAYGTEFDAIKSHLTGSGIVCIMKSKADIESNYSVYADFDAYRMDGTPMKAYKRGLLFDLDANEGGIWKANATLEADGYEFKGNSTDGYTLTLGNLLIYTSGDAIRLPDDGPVTVVLESGTYTYLDGVDAALSFTGSTAYSGTITGSGRLLVNGSTIGLMSHAQPIIISGGDISVFSNFIEAVHVPDLTINGGDILIQTDGMSIPVGIYSNSLTVNGGNINIKSKTGTVVEVDNFTLGNAVITDPENAVFDSRKKNICDINGNPVSCVTIEAILVEYVTVNPSITYITKGQSIPFTADVVGKNIPIKTVKWSIEGNNSVLTTISENGILYVGKNESAKAITVTATSTFDNTKIGMATVRLTTVSTYIPISYTLTFNTNGGSAIKDVIGLYGTNIYLSSYIPVQEGYTFTGWYTDPEFNNKATVLQLNGSTTVYAGWIENGKLNADEAEPKIDEAEPAIDETEPVNVINNPFNDVNENDWFFDDVMFAYENKLMVGFPLDLFNPTESTTRGMIVTILYRLDGEPDVNGECPFDDVEAGSYYEKAITWAAANNIVEGNGNGKFNPDDFITREQMAAILYRYADYKKYSISETADISGFSDYDKINSYADNALAWANARELVNGVGSNLLDPAGTATRVQVAAILHRFCVNIVK